MPYSLQPPSVGEWFQVPPDATFEVVAVDPNSETVEVQYFDGTVEEFDFETWSGLNLTAIPEPEDISGALDLQRDDLDADAVSIKDWSNPLDKLDEMDDDL